uniref:Uncharacterized protein n=1 Tax=Glossina palpalis gambiensis TaxID=67801 RepID=A0A1B0AW45_9MUSC
MQRRQRLSCYVISLSLVPLCVYAFSLWFHCINNNWILCQANMSLKGITCTQLVVVLLFWKCVPHAFLVRLTDVQAIFKIVKVSS